MSCTAIALTQEPNDDSDNERLREVIRESLVGAVKNMVRAAQAAAELWRRGDKMEWLAPSIRHKLLLIASGNLLPEVLTRFDGAQNGTFLQIAKLPTEQQRTLASGERIEVSVQTSPGHYETRMMAPEEMPSSLVRQVFANGRIRTVSEQNTYLSAMLNLRAAPRDLIRATPIVLRIAAANGA